MLNNLNPIIKLSSFSNTDTLKSEYVDSVRGFIKASDLPRISNVLKIDSNPRKPKESKVTKDIIASLDESPHIFHLMTKGLLISCSKCEILDRGRIRIESQDNQYAQSGILDGGHNTFAILKFILQTLNFDVQKLREWDDVIKVWRDNLDQITSMTSNTEDELITKALDFLIPIEFIYPKKSDDKDSLNGWGITHSNITHARNNNVELVQAAKDNHQGYYDYLKDILPKNISKSIQWKTNDEGSIRVADVLALTLIPLSVLPPSIVGINLENNLSKIYNSKSYCVDTFKEILDQHGQRIGSNKFELDNSSIKSALDLMPEILELYDLIYSEFPTAYNNNEGSFGRMEVVKKYDPKKAENGNTKYLKKQPKTKYFDSDCEYNYADGLIIPLVVALRKLIEFDEHDEILKWRVKDPIQFIKDNLGDITKIYGLVIKMSDYNPQRIGKTSNSYDLAATAVESKL